jgi:hypothetical protein
MTTLSWPAVRAVGAERTGVRIGVSAAIVAFSVAGKITGIRTAGVDEYIHVSGSAVKTIAS